MNAQYATEVIAAVCPCTMDEAHEFIIGPDGRYFLWAAEAYFHDDYWEVARD